MFSFTVLGSGSAGNCAVVATEKCRLLIDAGLSARQIALRLAVAGIAPEQLDGILLTHEHSDHLCGLEVFCKKFDVPVFANSQTIEAARRICGDGNGNWRVFATGAEFSVGDIVIESFSVPHDAVDPVGFVLHNGEAALGIVTDLGFVTKPVFERVRACVAMLIETNHDEKLLQLDMRRPWPVKQRILSRHGHLSNVAAADVIARLAEGNLRRAVLGHLSRDCNDPSLALGAVRARLGVDCGIQVVCASQDEPLAAIRVGGDSAAQ